LSIVLESALCRLVLSPEQLADRLHLNEAVLQHFESPLAAFVAANPAFDPAGLAQVCLVFDRTQVGGVVLDESVSVSEKCLASDQGKDYPPDQARNSLVGRCAWCFLGYTGSAKMERESIEQLTERSKR